MQTLEDEHLSQLSKECSLMDMLAYDDVDHDTHRNLNEFYAAFSKLYTKFSLFCIKSPVVDMETELKDRFSFLFSLSFSFYPALWDISAGAHFPAVKSFSNTTSQVIYFFVLLFSLFASSLLSHPRVVPLCQPNRKKVLGPGKFLFGRIKSALSLQIQYRRW